MNKKFTKLMAALALLVFMTPNMVGWGQTTVTQTSFTALSGNVNDDPEVSYASYKGGGTSDPAINSNAIRLYQNANGQTGGYVVIGVTTGYQITSATIQSTMATTTGYKLTDSDPGSTTPSKNTFNVSNYSLSANTDYTVSNISTQYITFACFGTSSSSRLYLSKISVTYESTGGGSTTYTVTYDANGGTGTMTDPDSPYEAGAVVTLLPNTFTAPLGYAFNGWAVTDASSTPVTVTTDNTFTMPASNVTVTAQWQAYTITAQSNNTAYGTVSLSDFTITASPVNGYRVSTTTPYTVSPANSATVSQNGNVFTVTPSENTTVTINFEAIPTHTITFHAGSGACETESSSGLEGSSISLPTAEPSSACASRGWEFAGWATASVSQTNTAPTLYNDTYTITANVDLYAVYTVEEEGNSPTAFSVGNTGTYAIVSEKQGNKYYALPTNPTVSSGKITAQEITVSEMDGVKYIATSDASGFAWTIASATNGYTLSDGSKYIYHSNGGSSGTNLAYGNSTSYTWSFTAVDGCIKMAGMNGSTTGSRGMLFSGTDIGGYSLTNWNTSGYYKTMILPVADATVAIYATSPDCLEKVATPTFTVTGTAIEGEENTYNGAISVTINCTTEDASIQYKLTEDGAWQNYSTALSISQSTTIWAKATKDGMDDSDEAEATYTIKYTLTLAENEDVLPLLFDGEENPIEIDDETGTATIEAGTEVRVSIDMIVNCKVFSGLSVTNVGEGGITEIEPNVYYSFSMPAQNSTLTVTTAETAPQILTVAGLGHINSGELHFGPESDIINLMELASNEASICGQMNVSIHELTIAANYELQSVTLTIGNTTEEVPMIEGFYTFTMPTSAATLTFNINKITMVVDELTRSFIGVTSSSYTDWSGKKSNSTAVYAGKTSGGDSNKTYIQLKSADSNSGIITTTSGGRVKEIAVTWNSSTSDGRTLDVYGKNTPYSEAADLYGNNNPNQGTSIGSIVKGTSTELTVDGDYTYIGLRSKSGAMYIDKIEITWDNSYSATMTVEAYDVDAETGWYFIASPFSANNSLVATDEDYLPVAMDDDATDLYYYDEPTHMWMNYKKHPNDFTFANGVGYLYANSQDVTLTFAGTSLVSGDTKEITLSYTEAAAPLAGWNLVGNPFDCNAILDKPCYTISGMAINTEAQTANEYLVGPCKGVLVKATENGETVTFTKVAAGQTPQPNQLQMIVAQQVVTRNGASTGSATVEDNAIVSFNEGNRLEKFAFNADAAKLYIPQNGKEYAIVSAEGQGEMPVNFRANADGQYTLTVNPEGIEMGYLHLIDNMTGANIDLLNTPAYTFNATTKDYESRFRLVFSANNAIADAASEETFAFFSNGSLIVNNEGEATLQVVDMMGRVVSNQTVNGTTELSLNQVPGVYVLRLVSGDNVRTQKVIVK